ncbi:MAG: peptide ABC transporter permease [Candidatus Wallbacteria bacterium HGW-Wallbacteria-1]|uniref:Peptide ABC transporter permease n=1 Tax=Candidatus Wallbacteria bacterium HGW-Wallbacteria-1 TaxID=2013854 RepID=A0A2N1PTB3_9BACT|nr:MAG: peptide ABC transporter permease [Candidatus Wallbacteria bacterium HGW-Wallbacteria-1]
MVQKLKEIYGFDKPFYEAYAIWISKVVRFDLGVSDTFARPVWEVISERFPISITFGLIGFMLSYTICVPLGVWKAIKHGSSFDTVSSMIVFIGYSIPGWTAGVFLLLLLGGGSFWNIFPLGGITSDVISKESYLSAYLTRGGPAVHLPKEIRAKFPKLTDSDIVNENHEAFSFMPADKIGKLTEGNFADLSTTGRFMDRVWHMFLPILCYMIGSFASLTMLMKNSLMENLGQDYVRTAFAKGLSEKTVIFKHALRNSLIPIATGLGNAISLVLAGSYLIEKVFNIQGFGLLGYTSIIARDYPVTLGILVIGSTLKLLGNIISDFLYCMIDPRIRFQ